MSTTARDHKVSPSPPATASAVASPKSFFSDAGDDILAAIAFQEEPTDRTAPPAAGDEEDRLSSVSQTTAMASPALAGDRGERGQARLQEIEDEIMLYLGNAANKVPVAARAFITTRLGEIVRLYSDLRSDVSAERGAAVALRGELVEARREVAALQRRAIVAEGRLDGSIVMAPGPGGAGRYLGASAAAAGSGPGVPAAAAGGGSARAVPTFEHVAFLTPTVPTTTPGRDGLRLLKTNIDPAAKNIGEVTLRHTRKSYDQLWRSAAFYVLHPRAVGGRPSRRRVQVPTGTDPRGTGRRRRLRDKQRLHDFSFAVNKDVSIIIPPDVPVACSVHEFLLFTER
ncbi:uncharacterized protein [Dermacentor albipictus]|uniref:uncharacterized protein n=1 Tax=Dermacentor albipictus TaxID=60249 RepID=UPI0038FD1938